MTKPLPPPGEDQGEGIQQCNLHALGILITRPRHQAQPLYDAIIQNGGKPVLFPAIEIAPPDNPARSKRQLQDAAEYEDLIFISPNAVNYAIGDLAIGRQRIFAIGEATGKMLQQHNLKHYLPMGEKADSESLLASPQLQEMQGRRVLIIRGNGGRALLGDTLIKRGATVEYAEIYQRRCPDVDTGSLLQKWPQEIDVIIATSNSIIDNLLHLCHNDQVVLQTLLIVISERMRIYAQQRRFQKVYVARGSTEKEILPILCHLLLTKKNMVPIQRS